MLGNMSRLFYKTHQKIMKKNRVIEETINEMAELVEQRLDWEKKNLVRNRSQFCRDCNVTLSTLNNFLRGRKGFNLSTAITVLNEAGYKIRIEPI